MWLRRVSRRTRYVDPYPEDTVVRRTTYEEEPGEEERIVTRRIVEEDPEMARTTRVAT